MLSCEGQSITDAVIDVAGSADAPHHARATNTTMGRPLLRKMSDFELGEALFLSQARFAESVSPATHFT